MATLRLHIGDSTIYDGPAIAVPRVGESLHHNGEIVPVEAVVWDFTEAPDVVSVEIVAGGRPYTF